MRVALCSVWMVLACAVQLGAVGQLVIGTRDSGPALWAERGEVSDDAQRAVLDALSWEPACFEVTVSEGDGGQGSGCDAVVRFVTPMPCGDAAVDGVVLEWFKARDAAGALIEVDAPAVVVVQSLHPQRVVSRAVARGLSMRGLHGLVVTLPGFGPRGDAAWRGWHPGVSALVHGAMGVADVRRSLDAAAALPGVVPGRVALAGVSMGAMASAVVAGLDDRAAFVALFMAGADLPRLLAEGQQDAAMLREQLVASGAMERVRVVLPTIEPATVAGRWPARGVWLVSARFDQVVPTACTRRLIEAGGLPADRVVWVNGNHYNGVLGLPAWSAWLSELIRQTR